MRTEPQGVPQGMRWNFRRATVSWLLFLFPLVLVALLLVNAKPDGAGMVRSPLDTVAILVGLILAILFGGSLALLYLAVTEIYRGEPPTFESHWGGFGGGLGGWRISSSLAYLLGAFFLGGLFTVLATTGLASDPVQRWLGAAQIEERQENAAPSSPSGEDERQESTGGGSAAGAEDIG